MQAADGAITPAHRTVEIKGCEAQNQMRMKRAYSKQKAKATVAQRQIAAKMAETVRHNAASPALRTAERAGFGCGHQCHSISEISPLS